MHQIQHNSARLSLNPVMDNQGSFIQAFALSPITFKMIKAIYLGLAYHFQTVWAVGQGRSLFTQRTPVSNLEWSLSVLLHNEESVTQEAKFHQSGINRKPVSPSLPLIFWHNHVTALAAIAWTLQEQCQNNINPIWASARNYKPLIHCGTLPGQKNT